MERFKSRFFGVKNEDFHSTAIFSRDFWRLVRQEKHVKSLHSLNTCFQLTNFLISEQFTEIGWDLSLQYFDEKKIVKLNRVKFPIHSRFFKVSFTLAAWLLDGGATRKTACAQNTHARHCGPSLQRRRAVPRQARPLNNETQFKSATLQVYASLWWKILHL